MIARKALAGVFVAALAAACGGAGAVATDTPAAPEPEVAAVESALAVEREVASVLRATGTFVPDEASDVTPQVSGQIVATPVGVGDAVAAGQVLVRLDDRDAGLRLRQAEAALLQAEAQAQRARAEAKRNAELVQSGDISRSSYEQLTTAVAVAEAAVAQASAQVAAAEKAVADAVVVAPFAGHVSARPVAVGEYVTTASKVATVVRLRPIKLQLAVPESAAAAIRKGMAVAAAVPAHPGRTFTGLVSALNPAIDPASRAMTVEATFANADAALAPGMFGTGDVRLPATERAVFVPGSAVVPLPNGESEGVYVVDGEIARLRVVQTGGREDGAVRILAGLDAGARVATTGAAQLFDGARVRAAAPAGGGAAQPRGQ